MVASIDGHDGDFSPNEVSAVSVESDGSHGSHDSDDIVSSESEVEAQTAVADIVGDAQRFASVSDEFLFGTLSRWCVELSSGLLLSPPCSHSFGAAAAP